MSTESNQPKPTQEELFPEILDFYHIPEEVNLEIIEALQSRFEEYYIESLGHLTTGEIK